MAEDMVIPVRDEPCVAVREYCYAAGFVEGCAGADAVVRARAACSAVSYLPMIRCLFTPRERLSLIFAYHRPSRAGYTPR